jgi:single-stranded-DNA-specific exonuclease
MAGVREEQKQLQPDDIGFKLGPRINAVGRIGDPQTVIELLTTNDPGVALERAMQCEQINRQRQHLCEQIEQEAIALIETTQTSGEVPSPRNWQEARVLVLVQENWHHGTIGIVASRLVERYGVPTFIGTYEEEDKSKIRGSARGIEEFHVFDALEFCQDLLGKFGGHKAAGGFSLPAQNLLAFEQRLSKFACQCLKPEYLKPLVKIDAQAKLDRLSLQLYQQIDSLQPWGIGNDFPVFWTPNVRIKEQQIVGKNHLKLTIAEDDSEVEFKALAWRWGEYFPLPNRLDLAYKLRENHWNGNANLELEIVGVRLSQSETRTEEVPPLKSSVTEFSFNGRSYTCSLLNSANELKIINDRGKVLLIGKGKKVGVLGTDTDNSQRVDVTKPPYYQLVKTALEAIGNK